MVVHRGGKAGGGIYATQVRRNERGCRGGVATAAVGLAGVIHRAIVSNIRSVSSGLAMWSTMPAAMTFSRSPAMTLAVMAMIGRSARAGVPADFACRGEAVHDRHLAVHQDTIETMVPGQNIERFLSVIGNDDLDAGVAQKFSREFLIEFVVFDQQQPRPMQFPRRRRPVASSARLAARIIRPARPMPR